MESYLTELFRLARKIENPDQLGILREAILQRRDPDKPRVRICLTGCRAFGAVQIRDAFRSELQKRNLEEKIEPEWLDSKFAYPPEHRKTMIVKCIISDKNIEKVSFLPVLINKQAQPVVITRQDENFGEIMSYVDRISKDQGLNVELLAEGDEVVVCT